MVDNTSTAAAVTSAPAKIQVIPGILCAIPLKYRIVVERVTGVTKDAHQVWAAKCWVLSKHAAGSLCCLQDRSNNWLRQTMTKNNLRRER